MLQNENVVDSMNRDGYAVLHNVIPDEIIHHIAKNLDKYYEQDQQKFGKDFLFEINESEVIRNVIAYDDIFIKLLEDCIFLDELMEKLLHKFTIIHNYNLIRLFPELKTKMLGHDWHRDVYYFGPGIRTAVNVIIPVNHMNKENGSTELLPGSHLHADKPSDSYIEEHKISSELNPGDVLLVDAATFHSAGKNTSNKPRTIIVLKYTMSFFTQQYDICRALPVENYSERVKGRLGYYVRVPDSIEKFRVKPESRMYKWPIRY
ncbi:MAG: phytanoyl-CoA dioxygenase family protein [Bacteroidota bacterium]|nr:phytanoyl-CoA dioxygenase family protein [Bacteroidota bacterium]